MWRAVKDHPPPTDGTEILVHTEANPDLGPLIVRWKDRRWLAALDDFDVEREWGDRIEFWMPVEPHPTFRKTG
jgi:hypothetical protein